MRKRKSRRHKSRRAAERHKARRAPLLWRRIGNAAAACFAPADTAVPSAPAATWRYLPHMLLAAFVARAAVALSGDFRLHPDEVMQYLEPAHHAVFGYGVLYWEYLHGARPWLIPGFVAGILQALDALGLGRPQVYVEVVKLSFCLLSLLIPWSMYRFTQHAAGERAARLALLLGCFWYELVLMAHKPFSEFVSTACFLFALALLAGDASGRRRALAAAGALLTLCAAVRLQYAPAALLLLALRSLSLQRAQLAALWGGAAVLAVLVGILEWLTWGAPFHSYMTNFLVNYKEIFLSGSGGSSRWRLPGQLLAAGGGVSALAFYFGAKLRGPARLLLLLSAVTFFLHMLPSHREYRFIFLLVPCWLMLLAMLLARAGDARPALPRFVPAALLAYGALALANIFPWQPWVHLAFSDEDAVYYLRNQSPEYAVIKYLGAQDDVRGVIYTIPRLGYHKSGGYYYLHHDVPFYTDDVWHIALKRPLTSLASHIVTDDKVRDGQIPGFSETYRAGDMVVWRRDVDAPVPQWRENVPRVFLPGVNQNYRRLIMRLRGTWLRWFLAERYWLEVPPRIEFAEPAQH